jgi:hypothetical protein
MLGYFLFPPGVYYLAVFVLIVATVTYWQRKAVYREIKKWRIKGLKAWIIEFERKGEKKSAEKSDSKTGIHIGDGANFENADIGEMVGGSRLESWSGNELDHVKTGITIGENANFKGATIEEMTGGHHIETGSELESNKGKSTGGEAGIVIGKNADFQKAKIDRMVGGNSVEKE